MLDDGETGLEQAPGPDTGGAAEPAEGAPGAPGSMAPGSMTPTVTRYRECRDRRKENGERNNQL